MQKTCTIFVCLKIKDTKDMRENRWFWVCLMVITITVGCSEKHDPIIPDVSFNATIYLNDPAFSGNPFVVRTDQSGRIIGVNGVVVYRSTPDEYFAFDRMCTHEKRLDCSVKVTDGATVTCPCCESRFLIVTQDASIINGPAVWPLKAYRTSVNGDYLHIWN
jgi:nitrite reductase/ring-hydroxylating ferredoxin subunit